MTQPKICVEGRNCGRIVTADRAAFLVDAEKYFSTLIEAFARARRSIMIAGWQVDSRLRLTWDEPKDGLPAHLGDLLHALVNRRRGLHIYVLAWDFAMIYALEREIIPLYTYPWRAHRRIHFRLDSNHPLGASHHQKIIVVDDALAFAGGMDLAEARWDTSEHRADEPRRVTSANQPYRAYHDVQLMVDGAAAGALGDLVRERWRRATGRRIRAQSRRVRDLWTPDVKPDFERVSVAIARTEPAYEDRPTVREVEALYLDGIRAARRFIYFENQYLTSASIGDALAAKLQEQDGPEIVIATTKETEGWLEEATMGVLRSRLMKRLQEADRFRRLRVCCPVIPEEKCCMSVHSKVAVIDDRLVRVGSANLNNRSMGLDTECDLGIEAHDGATEQAIARFRNRLLGEHLGVAPEKMAEAHAAEQSLVKAIDKLGAGPRTLCALDGTVPEWLDQMIPQSAVLDPESPLRPDELVDQFLPVGTRKRAGIGFLRLAAILLLLTGLAAVWQSTALADMLGAGTLNGWAGTLQGALQDSPLAPLLVIGTYVLGSFVLAPVSLLIILTAATFDPVPGFVYALTGSVLSSIVMYAIGRIAGKDAVRRIAGTRLGRLQRQISRHGLLSVLIVRVFPVAPFTVVNLVAGASQVRLRDFILGTFIGMGPGILALVILEHQLYRTLRDPAETSFALFMGLSLFFGALAVGFYRWILKKPLAQARRKNGDLLSSRDSAYRSVV
jgi:phosphatidylserine/phosphatidylglycerophosphate/cardiolipin synthase-like enzyme/uncharacterized membrane protein YdjX (TVP38/TMEM64 family)